LLLASTSSTSIFNSTFSRNIADGLHWELEPGGDDVLSPTEWGGGCIAADAEAVLTIQDSVFSECRADRGSALMLGYEARVDITSTSFVRNTSELMWAESKHVCKRALQVVRYIA
jgi:hypothetical protein